MLQMILNGGWVMLPLAVCSIVSLTVIVERVIFFRRTGMTQWAEKILSMLEQKRLAESLPQAQSSSAPLVKVLMAGLNNRYQPAKAMETVAISELAAMRRGLPVLDTIITLSPLLGLLGTIIGMISSFQLMAVSGMGQPHAVTGGISEALVATASGIIVAVITLIPYNYFLARIEQETDVMEQYASRLEMLLAELVKRDAV